MDQEDPTRPRPYAAPAKRWEADILKAEAQRLNLDVVNSIAAAIGPVRRASPAADVVVAGITSRYVGEKDRFYYDAAKTRLAFEDRGARMILGESPTASTIRDVLNIATARGWDEIALQGTAGFKRAAYLEAQGHGIAIRNYKPDAGTLREASLRRDKIARTIEKDTGTGRSQRVDPVLERAYLYLDQVATSLDTPLASEMTRKSVMRTVVEQMARRVRDGGDLRDLPAVETIDKALAQTSHKTYARNRSPVAVQRTATPGPLAAERAAAVRGFETQNRPKTEDRSLRFAYAVLREIKDALDNEPKYSDGQRREIFTSTREHVAKLAEEGKRLEVPAQVRELTENHDVSRSARQRPTVERSRDRDFER